MGKLLRSLFELKQVRKAPWSLAEAADQDVVEIPKELQGDFSEASNSRGLFSHQLFLTAGSVDYLFFNSR